MALLFPCEVMQWYFLPAVRKELSTYLIKEKKLPRKKVGELLGLTQSALSQYLKGKRGNKFALKTEFKKQIHTIAEQLMKKKSNEKTVQQTCELCRSVRSKMTTCETHKSLGALDLTNTLMCAADFSLHQDKFVQK